MDMRNKENVTFCRICLAFDTKMTSLLNEPGKGSFLDLTNIEVSEDPICNWLCVKCCLFLDRLRTFKNKALLVDETLRKYPVDSPERVDKLRKFSKTYGGIQKVSVGNSFTFQACPECDDSARDDSEIAVTVSTNGRGAEKRIDAATSDDDADYDVRDASTDGEISRTKDEDPPAGEISKKMRIDLDIDSVAGKRHRRVRKKSETSRLKRMPSKSEKVLNACNNSVLQIDIKSEVKLKRERPKRKSVQGTVDSLDATKASVIELSLEDQMKEIEERRTSDYYRSARYKCEVCVKVFPYRESLQNHMSRHKESYGNCECDVCHQRFLNKRILKSHHKTHARRYSCRLCDRQLHFKTTMIHHLLRHDNTYVCRVCGHRSKGKNANRLHQRIHSSLQTYKCPQCPKILNNKHDYGVHVRRHTGDMPFVCDDCGKCFQTNATLVAHRAVHSTTRDFYCAECDVSFKTKDIMLTHFRKSAKHIDPALLSISCTLCPKKFELESQRAAHVDSYHLRQARLACDACPARFVSSNGLRNHRRRKHEGLKPPLSYVCETCGRGFTTKALVTNHLRTHTGEQPFECETCHRRFSQKSAMKTHVKLVHLKMKRIRSKQLSLSSNDDKVQNQFIGHPIHWPGSVVSQNT